MATVLWEIPPEHVWLVVSGLGVNQHVPAMQSTCTYIKCLSSGPLCDTYTHTTVTVLYTTIRMQYLAQADIGCSNSTGSWEASVLRYIASSLDQVFVVGNGTENEDTRTSCSACLSPQLATELGTTSDSIYHCVG